MTELYLDCEFNGNNGHLISIALYNPKGESFYEVDDFWISLSRIADPFDGHDALKPWVRENVIPMLNKKAISIEQIKGKLSDYLAFEDDVTIYADWPEDFVHLCKLLFIINVNTETPRKLIEKLTMKLITTPDTHVSKLPHNALEDAKALYLNHLEMKKVSV